MHRRQDQCVACILPQIFFPKPPARLNKIILGQRCARGLKSRRLWICGFAAFGRACAQSAWEGFLYHFFYMADPAVIAALARRRVAVLSSAQLHSCRRCDLNVGCTRCTELRVGFEVEDQSPGLWMDGEKF